MAVTAKNGIQFRLACSTEFELNWTPIWPINVMYKPNDVSTTPSYVPQEGADISFDQTPAGTTLGAFSGYLRRAKPSSQGLLAQFFGENGPDSDVICVLGLTKFLDALVKVSVWGLKDSQGNLMRGEDRKPPLLTEFIARIRRPSPSNLGQTALFFGENGSNADAINKLNESRLQDSLVYIEISKADPGQTPAEIQTLTPEAALEEQTSRLTPQEKKAQQGQQRKAAEALKILRLNQFFQNEAVWEQLGSPQVYRHWVEHQSCCHPGDAPCDQTPVEAFTIPGDKSAYSVVPLCRQHAQDWRNSQISLAAQTPLAFLHTRHISLIQRWAEERLRHELKVPTGYDPTPNVLFDWTVRHKFSNLIPRSFTGLL